jgi:hypothetical protein
VKGEVAMKMNLSLPRFGLNVKTLCCMLMLLPLATACASESSKSGLDAEVKRLCQIDGGIKVYETVRLPPENFNRWGQLNFYKPSRGEDALGNKYLLKIERHEIVKGNPSYDPTELSMIRTRSQIIRKLDLKLLGESVVYLRVGGDPPGLSHSTSFACPDVREQGEAALFKKVFLKQEKGE